MKTFFRISLFTVIIGFFSIAAILQLESVRTIIKDYLIETIEARSDYQISMGHLRLDPSFQANAFDLTVSKDGQVLAHIDRLSVNLYLLPLLWDGNLLFRSIDVENLTIQDLPEFEGHLKLSGGIAISPRGKITRSNFQISSDDIRTIQGKIAGTAVLKGTIFDPEINLQLESSQIAINENVFENVNIKIASKESTEGQKGQIDIAFTHHFSDYHFHGAMSTDTTPGPFPLHLELNTSLTDLFQLLDINVTDVKGDVALNLNVDTEKIEGSATLSHGLIEIYELGCLMTNIEGTIAGDANKLKIHLSGSDGSEGKIQCSGKIDLNRELDFPLDLNFKIRNAAIVQLDRVYGKGNADLHLIGTSKEAAVKGTALAKSLKIELKQNNRSIAEPLDVTYINHPMNEELPTEIQKQRLTWPLQLEIELDIPKNAKVIGNGLSSEWKGKTLIKGTPNQLDLQGEFQIIQGKYLFRGKTIHLNKGTVTLAGDPIKKTSLYLIAELAIEKATIEAILKGPIKNPTISLRSNPPMSQREILSRILFNKNIEEISKFQGRELNHSLISLENTGDEGPDIMTRVSKALGVDSIEISGVQEGEEEGVCVQMGKYLSDKTMISLKSTRRTSDTSSNSIGIETNLNKNFTLQAEVDDDSNGQVNLLWKKHY